MLKNITTFLHTRYIYLTNKRLKNKIKYSKENQYIIYESENFSFLNEHNYDKSANMILSKKRTVEAAKQYYGKNVCIHNFANATLPGGGVLFGTNAQEESICRISTLYPNLTKFNIKMNYYWKHKMQILLRNLNYKYNGDCIYTPSVTVFKTDEKRPLMLSEKDYFDLNVISCVAPNLSSFRKQIGLPIRKITNDELYNIHLDRLTRICEVAKRENQEVLILGAFGCGEFQNKPKIVAKAMRKVILKYQFDFEVIEVAVFCNDKNTHNYNIFKQILGDIMNLN